MQLIARGTPIRNIRILDIREPERDDMLTGPAAEIGYIHTDIRSLASVTAAFGKPWHSSVADLPLTVFHTAAVILSSDRSRYTYELPHAVNVQGTNNLLTAAKSAGADIFVCTSSGSISVRWVNPWVWPWRKEPTNYWQIQDERDFDRPLASHDMFYGNYAASKAAAERLVCAANKDNFRTGCIRPANGVYGNIIDNCVGAPLSTSVQPT